MDQRKTDGLLLEGKAAAIEVDVFNAEMEAFLPRIDFRHFLQAIAGALELTEDKIAAEQVKTYVQQLELIEHSEEDVIEAINHYLMASAECSAWSKEGIVHDKSFDEYEKSLIVFWKNNRTVHEIVHKNLSSLERGRLMLAICNLHKQKLQDLEVPAFFTPESFHALADDQTVGWHPDYQSLLSTGGTSGKSK